MGPNFHHIETSQNVRNAPAYRCLGGRKNHADQKGRWIPERHQDSGIRKRRDLGQRPTRRVSTGQFRRPARNHGSYEHSVALPSRQVWRGRGSTRADRGRSASTRRVYRALLRRRNRSDGVFLREFQFCDDRASGFKRSDRGDDSSNVGGVYRAGKGSKKGYESMSWRASCGF